MAKQKVIDGFEPNMERYRKASQPHESEEAAHKSLREFQRELEELRIKYRVRDLYVICTATMIENGGEVALSTSFKYGTQTMWIMMAAQAYGEEKSAHEAMVRKLLESGGRHAK